MAKRSKEKTQGGEKVCKKKRENSVDLARKCGGTNKEASKHQNRTFKEKMGHSMRENNQNSADQKKGKKGGQRGLGANTKVPNIKKKGDPSFTLKPAIRRG